MKTPGLLTLKVVSSLVSGAIRVFLCSAWELHAAPPNLSLPSAVQDRDVGFTQLRPEDTGIYFTNHISLEAVAKNRLVEDGSGVAIGDVDGDGLADVYLCHLEEGNRLYRNLGNLHFRDITSTSGVACPGQASTGAVFADVDGDGDLDLLVNGLRAGTRLFLNDGLGHFTEKMDAGLQRTSGARSLALADIDGDGDLDLYVTHYRPTTSRDEPQRVRLSRRGAGFEVPVNLRERFVAEANDHGGAVLLELGEPDALYRNLGGGKFEEIAWTAGNFFDDHGKTLREPPRDWGLSAMFRDLNGDGAPELYVCNDFHSPDRLWLNLGNGQFRAAPATALRKFSWASMAVDFADLNRDGLDDFFVAEMLGVSRIRRQTQRDNLEADGLRGVGWGWADGEITQASAVMRNTLLLNLDGGHFAEIAHFSGVQASDWTWGAIFLDVDLDGYEDLLIANGHARDHLNSDIQTRLARAGPPKDAVARAALFRQIPPLPVMKRAFRNRGDLTFEDRSTAWGFDWIGISTGMALGDLDNDGDLDVVLNNMDSGALILRNDSRAPRIAVRVQGRAPNTGGIGARIRVLADGLPPQTQQIICGGRYLSADDPVRTFASGQTTNPIVVEVTWRNGQKSAITQTNRQGNSLLIVTETTAVDSRTTPTPLAMDPQRSWFEAFRSTLAAPLFQDVSERVQLAHVHPPYNDLARQPLLPRKLSHNGPGLSWIDLNGDGHDDLVLPHGRGAIPQSRLGDGTGKFIAASSNELSPPADSDRTTVLGWLTGPQKGMIVTGEAGGDFETNVAAGLVIHSFLGAEMNTVARFKVGSNLGPVAAADIDADGDLDLFVGGQAEPGRYPRASPSLVFNQTDGRFTNALEATARLSQVGLVNGAIWSDLNGDGWPELILACEWGPIRIFRNELGHLVEASVVLTQANRDSRSPQFHRLSELTGWWNGVTVGDFNGDGRLDILATNWGRNSKYQEFIADGLRLYHGDLNGNKTWELIEAYWDPEMKQEVPWRDFRTMSLSFPLLLERFPTYATYASASVRNIFGSALDRAELLRANTLDSIVLLNFGDHFEVRSLPLLAQLAPAFGPVVADFDGDGIDDIFLSQNSFATDRETGRLDSGRGLLLHGDGRGDFTAISSMASGLELAGEQRGAAVADFDEDGRPDLAIAQFAGSVKLFRNHGGNPGRRIRLIGPAGNRSGIGAQIRLGAPGHYGPVRELHAGSGYWSQDSAVLIMATSVEPTHLWIRWPGGRTTETPLPPGVREYSVDSMGRLQ